MKLNWICLPVLFFLMFFSSALSAQNELNFPRGVNIGERAGMKFPDLPALTSDFIKHKMELPYSVDNSTSPYLRPVFNQQGASCGQATLVGYNFTYEINRLRNLTSDTAINLYPDHFVWNFMNSTTPYYGGGVSYFHTFDLLYDAGNPTEAVYGPIELDDDYYWASGYEVYHNAMTNRISGAASIPVGTPEGLLVLKHWLHNHLEGSETGGLASFYAGQDYGLVVLPQESADAGKHAHTRFGPKATHAMTIVGYNDSVCYDINNDGQFTNDLDITGDGIVDMRDWEYGAMKAVNSYGTNWGDDGFFYLMYSTLALEYGEQGGIWNNSVHVLFPEAEWHPKLTMKATISHNWRQKIRLRAGVSLDTSSFVPEYIVGFSHFNFQGSYYPMPGQVSNANEPIELGLDVSQLLSYVPADKAARFFLLVDEEDNYDQSYGTIHDFSLLEYAGDELIQETAAVFLPKAINNDKTTYTSVVYEPQNAGPVFLPDQTILINPVSDTLINLEPVAGQSPFNWQIFPDYTESGQIKPYPDLQTNILPVDDEENGYAAVTLPFSFPLAGIIYDTLYMHVDGYLMFKPGDMPYYYLQFDELYLKQLKAIAPLMHRKFGLFNEGDRLGWLAAPDSVLFEWQISDQNNQASATFYAKLFPDGDITFHYKEIQADMSFTPAIGLGFAELEESPDSKPFFSRYSRTLPPANLQISLKPGADLQRMHINQNQQLVWQGGSHNFGKAGLRMTADDRLFAEEEIFVTAGPEFTLILPDETPLIRRHLPISLDLNIKNHSTQSFEVNAIHFAAASLGFQVQANLQLPISLEPGATVRVPEACVLFSENTFIEEVRIDINANVNDLEIFSQDLFTFGYFNPVVSSAIIIDGDNQQLDPGEKVLLVYELSNLGPLTINDLEFSIQFDDPFVMLVSDSLLTIEKLEAGQLIHLFFEIQTSHAAQQGRSFEIVSQLLHDDEVLYDGHDFLQIGKSKIALIDLDRNHNSAPVMEEELQNNSIIYHVLQGIDSTIFNYELLFLTLGVMPHYDELNAVEDALLAGFLSAGGNIYLEGGSFFYMNPHTQLRELLRTEGFIDGVQYPADTLAGLSGSPVEGIQFSYQGDQAWCENLLPLEPAKPWFADSQTNLNYVAAIDSGSYKGIATSLEFGGLQALPGSSLTELMAAYLSFLGYTQTEVSARFEVSKRTSCPHTAVGFQFSGLGNPESIRWYFEGGLADDVQSANPVVTYESPGTYDVGLVVEASGIADSIFVENFITVNSCASIAEDNQTKLRLFPNPVRENLQLVLPQPASESQWIRLYDLDGRLVDQRLLMQGETECGMNIAKLKPGVYLIQRSAKQNNDYIKFIKM